MKERVGGPGLLVVILVVAVAIAGVTLYYAATGGVRGSGANEPKPGYGVNNPPPRPSSSPPR